MAKEINERPARAIVAAGQLPEVSVVELQASVSELRELCQDAGFRGRRHLRRKRDYFDTTAYLASAKIAEKVPLALSKVLEWE